MTNREEGPSAQPARPPLPTPAGEALSAWERTALRHLAQGHSNAQIAECMGRAEKTVRNRLSELYAKLQVPNRAAAVAVWMRLVADGPVDDLGETWK